MLFSFACLGTTIIAFAVRQFHFVAARNEMAHRMTCARAAS